MTSLIKHALRKFLIWRWYGLYVENNSTIQDDIKQTLIVRASKANSNTIEKQFSHVMLYYPEFAMIFFWRSRSIHSYWKSYFEKDYNCKIFKSTKIDGGMMCYHPFATVINAKSIGKNFQFRNSLTIGNKGNDNRLLPTIGHDVTVGANVVIIGDITIGDCVVIGAGSVVIKDVPSNCVIAGNPAQIIRRPDGI